MSPNRIRFQMQESYRPRYTTIHRPEIREVELMHENARLENSQTTGFDWAPTRRENIYVSGFTCLAYWSEITTSPVEFTKK